MLERSIAVTVHGRYLVEGAESHSPAKLMVGFHGYAENAEAQLERLRGLPASQDWVQVSIQGLHRFYQRKTNLVVSSWMTSQNREEAIAENVAFVRGCLRAVSDECRGIERVLFAGFSQGVAMAFRAAVTAEHPVAGVIAAGGDVPPELSPADLARIPLVMLVRGSGDTWYTAQKFEADARRLAEAGVRVLPVPFDGGHEWPVASIARFASSGLPLTTGIAYSDMA